MNQQEKEVYQSAIRLYGKDNQINQAIEEMCELVIALNKYRRGNSKDEDFVKLRMNVAEEIADVEIMIEQLKLMFSCSGQVDVWRKQKLKRLNDNVMEKTYGKRKGTGKRGRPCTKTIE